ncbi:HAD-IA family hydrolase [Yoonia sp. 208BN28-4]|uniref:HAD-IA family hydrolase n=1 Tax=Yoonia sp. 208BN28-4 TaxID=3126505 RepID=UPI00309BF45E
MRVVIFDVDGTLVDSQAEIMAAMEVAYAGEGLTVPTRQQVLSIVGLSLVEAFTKLSPKADTMRLVAGYKQAFTDLRGADGKGGESPLFAGMADLIDQLHAQDETLLAVATGKSKRGLDKMIERHGFGGKFFSQQVADFHPSKPHPAMVQAVLADTGVDADKTVMIGDTTYDIDMGRAAGVKTIGVAWGYHPHDTLRADRIVHDHTALELAIDELTGHTT